MAFGEMVVEAVQDEASPTTLRGESPEAKNLLLGEGHMVSVVVVVVVVVVVCLCSGRWLVKPFRTSNKLFYLTRPLLALLKSLLYNDR